MTRAGYSAESEQIAAWTEGRIAELMGVINAATAEVVAVIGQVLEEEGRPNPPPESLDSRWFTWNEYAA